MKSPRTLESWMMLNGKTDDHFYTDKDDKHLTAMANYYKRTITTERMITITTGGKQPEAKYITKVHLLN